MSLSAGQSAITNQFSGPSLHQRVGMMNGQRSGFSACWRYGIWVLLLGIMAIACRHRQSDNEGAVTNLLPFPLSNATRRLVAELDHSKPWFLQASLLTFGETSVINGRKVVVTPMNRYSPILRLQNNYLALKIPDGQQVKVFINGQIASEIALKKLTFEQIDDLFVYQKIDDFPEADAFPESYRVLISTTHRTPDENPLREKWKQYLQANTLSDYPGGNSSTFSMNKLLEATFFHNKLAFVERTKDEHLQLYDEYRKDIDLFVNGIRVDEKQIADMHVREVDKLYTRERPFDEWADGPDRKPRYVLYIQTAPNRAKRDSTYYVFSPFYSGDF